MIFPRPTGRVGSSRRDLATLLDIFKLARQWIKLVDEDIAAGDIPRTSDDYCGKARPANRFEQGGAVVA
jgi:hypothetical protein